jgi:putative glutamine amidotransferase
VSRVPLIGLSCYVEPVDRGDWRAQQSVVLPVGYVEHVRAAGGVPVVLPPSPDPDDAMIDAILDRIDGLILAGGVDVEAARYGATPHPTSQASRPDRDSTELALARRSRQRGTPTLGICRGMQVMAVETGGVLEQHIPERTGSDEHAPAPGVFGTHEVSLDPGGLVGRILGPLVSVPTYHHQGVLSHPGYRAFGWHADGTVEAIEDRTSPFRIAVQWHPEAGEDGRLFAALVRACRA